MGKPKPLKPAPMGRPSKLTKELMDAAVAYVAKGCYIETACQAVGIGRSTMHEWLRWGHEGREPYATFADTMLRARAVAEADDVSYIKSDKDWRARAWRLEKMHGRDYAGVTVTESRIDLDVKSLEEIGNKVRQIYAIAPPALAANVTPIDAEYEEGAPGAEVEASAGERVLAEGDAPADTKSGPTT